MVALSFASVFIVVAFVRAKVATPSHRADQQCSNRSSNASDGFGATTSISYAVCTAALEIPCVMALLIIYFFSHLPPSPSSSSLHAIMQIMFLLFLRLSVPAESAVQPSNKTVYAADQQADRLLWHRAPFDLSAAAFALSSRATLHFHLTAVGSQAFALKRVCSKRRTVALTTSSITLGHVSARVGLVWLTVYARPVDLSDSPLLPEFVLNPICIVVVTFVRVLQMWRVLY